MVKRNIKDIVYRRYLDLTNMSLRELKAWKRNPISRKISLNRKPINMAIRLKARSKAQWGLTEIRWVLKKLIPHLKRSRKTIRRNLRPKGYTLRQIALKNWGYDVKKRRR